MSLSSTTRKIALSLSITFAGASATYAQKPAIHISPQQVAPSQPAFQSIPLSKIYKQPDNVIDIETALELKLKVKNDNGFVLFFGSPRCEPCRHMKNEINNIAEQNPDITFYRINKETKMSGLALLIKEHKINMVPQVLFFSGSGDTIQKLDDLTLKGFHSSLDIQKSIDQMFQALKKHDTLEPRP